MTRFSICLQKYLKAAGCSSSELADTAGLQRASISRYLSGKRVPPANSVAPEKIAHALSVLSKGNLDEQSIRIDLANSLVEDDSYPFFPERLAITLDTFGIARNRLARSMDFDPSYISRILSKQRRPSDLPGFIEGVADYIARNHNDSYGVSLAADLTGQPRELLSSPQSLKNAIKQYLGSEKSETPRSIDAATSFFSSLDAFDLNDFLRQINFDNVDIATTPPILPIVKVYDGFDQMKMAELDFLNTAILSKSNDDIIIYTDMPIEKMATDKEYFKRVMKGHAMLMKRGVRIHNIHNVYRPIKELFIGFEGWMPLYMMGLMNSYYLPHATNDVFLHCIRSAGTVAIDGEAMAGNMDNGRYTLTKNPNDVAYVQRRAQKLLALSKPLVTIFTEGEERKLDLALERLAAKTNAEALTVGEETFRNVTITVWPKSHVLIKKTGSPTASFLVEHPMVVDALEHFEPSLFTQPSSN